MNLRHDTPVNIPVLQLGFAQQFDHRRPRPSIASLTPATAQDTPPLHFHCRHVGVEREFHARLCVQERAARQNLSERHERFDSGGAASETVVFVTSRNLRFEPDAENRFETVKERTSGKGPPFGVFADTMVSRNFARRFPVPLVFGLEEQLAGTLVDFVGLKGHGAVGFEGGQHDDPKSIDHLASIVWLALAYLGLVERSVSAERRILERVAKDTPRVLEVTYRHEVAPSDGFLMLPGFSSFQLIEEGQVIAEDVRGDVAPPEGGYLLMPLYQKQGDDGFFVVQKVSVFWLWLSALLRYARAGRIAHWLPGIDRVDGEKHRVLVYRRVARWYSLQFLHLLGFRRREERDDVLLMERRAHDLP